MTTLLGKSLADYRAAQGIRFSRMARELGLSVPALKAVEHGQQRETAELRHQVLVAYPDFFTVLT